MIRGGIEGARDWQAGVSKERYLETLKKTHSQFLLTIYLFLCLNLSCGNFLVLRVEFFIYTLQERRGEMALCL